MMRPSRHVLKFAGVLAALGTLAWQGAAAEAWDKTFPRSTSVNHEKVSFKNRLGIRHVADLYVPKKLDREKRSPALIVGPPFGGVKEQTAGLYAQTMAERGFVTLAFDPSFNGESGGQPHSIALPEAFVEDFSAAVDYLGLNSLVDRERIGVIGICGSGGFALGAAQIDPRIKAVATVSMYDMGRDRRQGLGDTMSEADRRRALEDIAKQRWIEAERGKKQYVIGTPEKIAADSPDVAKEFYDYYRSRQSRRAHTPQPREVGAFCERKETRTMKGTLLYGARDIRFEELPTPKITAPTDAVIRLSATCICGSDLWPYRGIQPVTQPTPMGHEYCGIVEEVGSAVRSVKPGQFVIGSFFASDNTCPNCRIGYQSSCQHRELVGGAQAPTLRVPLADGTFVATPEVPPEDLVPSLLAASDVFGTGWFAAEAANVKPGSTVVIVGDGAVGLLAVLAARQMGAERIIAMSRHPARQALAREFGATDVVTERGEEGAARIKEITKGVGADSVLECVGTQESMLQAIGAARPGGFVSYVGVPHGVRLDGEKLFFSHIHLHGGPAPVRRFLPKLIDLVWSRKVNPGKVFDLTLPLEKVAEGYRAMDERRAIKTLLRV